MTRLDQVFIPSDEADSLLSIRLKDTITSAESIAKSFFDIDLTSPEGVTSFLTILPVVSEEVLKQAVASLWPGYPVDEEFDEARHRFEIRGYLLDYLDEYEVEQEPVEAISVQGTGDTGDSDVLQ